MREITNNSTGQFLLTILMALYLFEKYLRVALSHINERRSRWGRLYGLPPILPVLLLLMFFSVGWWGQLINTRDRLLTSSYQTKVITLQHRFSGDPVWDDALLQCNELGTGWRLPTDREVRLLLHPFPPADSSFTGTWTAERLNTHDHGLMWGPNIPAKVTWFNRTFEQTRGCISRIDSEPTDLYQRVIALLYGSTFREHRESSFYKYFHPAVSAPAKIPLPAPPGQTASAFEYPGTTLCVYPGPNAHKFIPTPEFESYETMERFFTVDEYLADLDARCKKNDDLALSACEGAKKIRHDPTPTFHFKY